MDDWVHKTSDVENRFESSFLSMFAFNQDCDLSVASKAAIIKVFFLIVIVDRISMCNVEVVVTNPQRIIT